MIVIAIIGILAAIALPAYAKYMARARFTEVTSAVDSVKKQVELCIFDQGPSFTSAGASITVSACANGEHGSGWRIDTASNYATKYVASIGVDSGEITATAKSDNGLGGSTFIITPHFGAADTGAIDWQRNDDSTCIEADLC